jgi:hypothetical protein
LEFAKDGLIVDSFAFFVVIEYNDVVVCIRNAWKIYNFARFDCVRIKFAKRVRGIDSFMA